MSICFHLSIDHWLTLHKRHQRWNVCRNLIKINFYSSWTHHRLTFPEFIDGGSCGLSADIKENTNYIQPDWILDRSRYRGFGPTIGFDEWTKGIEEPSVAVKLLFILFLEAEYNLHWASSCSHFPWFCDNDTWCVSARLKKIGGYSGENDRPPYSNMCAVTSLPATESLGIPSW